MHGFQEKPRGDGGWINGGFFVLEPSVLDHIEGDATSLGARAAGTACREGQLSAFSTHGFWQPMDTLRDKLHLEELWESGRAPWRVW